MQALFNMHKLLHPERVLESEPRARWEAELRRVLEDDRTPLHLVGMGNPLRRDDSVGLQIVSHLVSRIGRRPRRNVAVHPPARMPERVFSKVDCKSERVLIFDAVETGGKPGSVVLARLDDSRFGYFATHNVPTRLVPGVAANPSNVYVGGVQPESLEIGEELSDSVRASARGIIAIVESVFGGGSDGPT